MWGCSASLLAVTTMSLLTFRAICEELKHVPCEADLIMKKFKNKDLAYLLSKAMRALSVAETVVAKQSDVIMQSNIEMSSFLHDKRVSESLPKGLTASTPKDDTAKFLPWLEVEDCHAVEKKSSITTPISYSSAVKTASTEHKDGETACPGESMESHVVSSEVNTRTARKRKKMPKIATGCKRGIVLGSCYRKMDVFLSRMGPDVNAH